MRIRTIKPTFFLNDSLAECDPLARLLFIGLWCAADCEGRLELRPKRLKAEVLPFDDVDITDLLKQLEDRQFIQTYKGDGIQLVQITTFKRHQRITGSEADAISSFCPPPKRASEHTVPNVETSSVASVETSSVASVDDGRKEGRKEGRKVQSTFSLSPSQEAKFAEAPSWDTFWGYAQIIGYAAEWHAKDRWLKASAENWVKSPNWQAYAARCRAFWEQDGRPMEPPARPGSNGDDKSYWKDKSRYDLVCGEIKAIMDRSSIDAMGTRIVPERDKASLKSLREQKKELRRKLNLTA